MDSDNFEMTQDEMQRIKEAMKDKQFVDLLLEYTKEISDPENKKRYEEEIIAMEKERGNNVRLLKPQPGFVIKTTKLSDNRKVFVNICTSPEVEDCSVTAETRNGKSGTHVSLPHSLSPVREDVDKAGKSCVVYDVCFHPNSYEKSLNDAQFKQLMIDSALDTLEKQGDIKVDRKNKRFPKMKYKGVAQASIIRPTTSEDSNMRPLNGTEDLINNTTAPVSNDILMEENVLSSGVSNSASNGSSTNDTPEKIVPHYKIKHRGYFDMQNFTHAREDYSTVPKELVVEINLPLAKSAASIDLDIFEKQLVLDSDEPPYHLEISLPYAVNDAEGKAQFNTNEKVLAVTLPVIYQQKNIASEMTAQPLVQDIKPSTNYEENQVGTNNLDTNMEKINGQVHLTPLSSDPSLSNDIDADDGNTILDMDPVSSILSINNVSTENECPHEDVGTSGGYKFDSLVSRLSQVLKDEQQHNSMNVNDKECLTNNVGNNTENLSGESASESYQKHSNDDIYSGVEDDISSSDQLSTNLDSSMENLSVQIDKTSLRDETASSMLVSNTSPNNEINVDNDSVAVIDTICSVANTENVDETKCAHVNGDGLIEMKSESSESLLSQLLLDEGYLNADDENDEGNDIDDEDDDCFIDDVENKVNIPCSDSPTKSILKRSNSEGYSEDDVSSSTCSYRESLPSLQNFGTFERIVASKATRKIKISESDTDYCDTEDDFSSAFSLKEPFTPEHKYCNFEGTIRRTIPTYTKSDGEYCDTEDDLSYSASSCRDLAASENNSAPRRRRVKSVTFDDKPTIFEFANVSKRQMKKQRKQDRRKQVYKQKHSPSGNYIESSELESTEGEVSDSEQQKGKLRKKGKREKKNLNYSNGLPPLPNSILTHRDEDTSQKKKKKKKKKNKVNEEKTEDSSTSNMSDNLLGPDVIKKETGSFSNQLIFELE